MRVGSVCADSGWRGLVLLKSIVVGRVRNASHALLSAPGRFTGTAGRVENCQIGVFLTYATRHGRTFLDRELYLPKAWTEDPARCAAAGIPADRGFKTKPELAMDMLARALDAGVPARWVTGDAVYGQYHRLRRTLEERGLHYVLVVPVSQRVIVKDGTVFGTEKRADAAVAGLRPTAWRTRSAVERSKGVRDYAWARMRINGAKTDTCDTGCSSAGPWPSPERSRVSSAAPEARRPGGNGPHRRGTVGH